MEWKTIEMLIKDLMAQQTRLHEETIYGRSRRGT
jgi:hypothetical protein